MSNSRLVNRNVVAERGRTSMRLEPELWDALHEICERESRDMSTLVRQVEAAGHAGGRTSAIRVFILNYFRYGRDRTRPCRQRATARSCATVSPELTSLRPVITEPRQPSEPEPQVPTG